MYYLPRTVFADDLALMRRIDELHLGYLFAGSRMLQTILVREGYDVGRLHVATLMKRMGWLAFRPSQAAIWSMRVCLPGMRRSRHRDEDAEFALRHIEPTTVLSRIVDVLLFDLGRGHQRSAHSADF